MTHLYLTRVLYTAMIGFLLTAASVVFIYSRTIPVHAQVAGEEYGGTVLDVEVNADPLDDIECPVYTNIENADPTDGLPPVFGVYIPDYYPAPTYDYENLFTPGVPVLGELDEFDPCATNDGVAFPLIIDPGNPEFYLTGTGDF